MHYICFIPADWNNISSDVMQPPLRPINVEFLLNRFMTSVLYHYSLNLCFLRAFCGVTFSRKPNVPEPPRALFLYCAQRCLMLST